jgi:uncharacterized phage-associated protein
LYDELKQFGSGPITDTWLGDSRNVDLEKFADIFPEDVRKTLDEVYENYMTKTAFELVVETHNEKPWLNARKGLGPNDQSGRAIADSDILEEYSNRK